MPSDYSEFVKAHYGSTSGKPTERMSQCAAKWRAHKAKNGGGSGAKMATKGKAKAKTKMMKGGSLQPAFTGAGVGKPKPHRVKLAPSELAAKGGSVFNINTDQVVPFKLAKKTRVGRNAWVTSAEMRAMASLAR